MGTTRVSGKGVSAVQNVWNLDLWSDKSMVTYSEIVTDYSAKIRHNNGHDNVSHAEQSVQVMNA